MSNNSRFFIAIFILLTLLILVMVSCEKNIDVDLDNTEPQLVIEAPLNTGTGTFEVTISRTSDYFDNAPNPTVEDAVVTLYDENSSTPLLHTGNGNYQAVVTAESNVYYQLKVEVDGQVYEATSFLPPKVELEEIEIVFEEENLRFDAGYLAYYRFQDPVNVKNYYRFLFALNGVLQDEAEYLSVLDDRILNGSFARRALFQERFDSGEEVTFILRHFDAASYDYFNSLSDIVGDGGGPAGGVAAPGNPNSNWSNDALGYFSAFVDDTLTVRIP